VLTVNALRAAGTTDPGRLRVVNEDRFSCDEARGLFIVIDGVGGQAAGGKAADVALSMLRERLERETGPVPERIREAVAIANNEIRRLAATRREWHGMACVLTIALVQDGRATIGHVGDTRLYKLRGNRIDKITSDHSPVGEREDSREISEIEAMRHPRRNEVYRDVGSEPHEPGDPEFVDIQEIPFELDAALLLCSDGLTDLVDSASITRIVRRLAGDPQAIARALIEAANRAGGNDNVTVVYVEGERFAAAAAHAGNADPGDLDGAFTTGARRSPRAWLAGAILAALALLAGGLMFVRADAELPPILMQTMRRALGAPYTQVVQPTQSISQAIERAEPGSQVLVEPGEYRERLTLKDGVRVVSRVPRGATIRLPSSASDAYAGPAVIATGLSQAEFVGFRIVGDAMTPLGVGILAAGSALSLIDIEVTGATDAGVSVAGGSPTLMGSDIHGNPGPALVIAAGTSPRISHNVFSRNGLSQRAPGTFTVEKGANPQFRGNVFHGVRPDAFATLDEPASAAVKHENWFVPPGNDAPGHSAAPRGRRGAP
jgi:serine/threonine protein phosphatase PrpC